MIALDTNILAYAAFATPDIRKDAAVRIVARAALGDAVLPVQVLVEFGNASLKRGRLDPEIIRRRIDEWAMAFTTVPTRPVDIRGALDLVLSAKIAYFDALIIMIARAAGATALISEDMQDGATYAGVRIVNPFDPANAARIDGLLTPSP